jgi:hypothetical protein
LPRNAFSKTEETMGSSGEAVGEPMQVEELRETGGDAIQASNQTSTYAV